MKDLREALSHMNQSAAGEPESPEPDEKERAPSSGAHKGVIGHIHRHDNGKHHVTVHDKHGQLVHHSEHGSWQEAANELGTHGASQPGENSEPGEPM